MAADVLKVMRHSLNAAVMNARAFPESAVLTAHADACGESHAAVAELIEAAKAYRELPTITNAERLDAAIAAVGGDA